MQKNLSKKQKQVDARKKAITEKAWIIGLWTAGIHALLSAFLVYRAAYAACFESSNTDLLYAIPHAVLNLPSLIVRIPFATTALVIFIAYWLAKLAMFPLSVSPIRLSKLWKLLLFLFPIIIIGLSAYLQIYFGSESPPRGLCYRFPTWIRPQDSESEWLQLHEKDQTIPADDSWILH